MELIELDANKPFLLNDPDVLWTVQSDCAEVYVVRLVDGQPEGRRRHLFTAEFGQVLFGIDPIVFPDIGLLVSTTSDTEMMKRSRLNLLDLAYKRQDTLFAEPILFMIESWILGGLAELIKVALPTRFNSIGPGQTLTIPVGGIVRPKQDIIWVRVLSGCVYYCSRREIALQPLDNWLPLTADTWLEATEETMLEACLTADLLDFTADPGSLTLWQALHQFHCLFLEVIRGNIQQEDVSIRRRLTSRLENDAKLVKRSFEHLASLGRRVVLEQEEATPLAAACRLICLEMGMQVSQTSRGGNATTIEMFAQSANLRSRKVMLRGDWYKTDSGPLLAFRESDGRPVALLPVSPESYELVDPVTGEGCSVTDSLMATLKPNAHMFYRPLPDGELTPGKLLQFVLESTVKSDLWTLLLMGIAGGLLGMIIPMVTGILFSEIIPGVDREQHGMMSALLVIGAVAALAFEITRGAALVRTEGKINAALQAAVWDRLMNLPVTFFRQFTVGDLANRANGINAIRQILSGVVIVSVFTSVFSLFNLGLLFYYSSKLALVACGLVALFLIVFTALLYAEIKYRNRLIHLEGKISGVVLQIITGIAKFRIAGGENRAYYLWAKDFGEQRSVAFQARQISAWQLIFNAMYPAIVSIIIFYAVINLSKDGGAGLPVADFLAFNTALTSFVAAAVALSSSFITLVDVFPLYKRVEPILQALPEVNESKLDPGLLTGDIEIGRVHFRYRPDTPLILQNVSLTIKRGEFVAIVGSSGSGKSTLLRLLLGFERPEAGTIYYDRQDIAGLNIRGVRSQIGVVLQNGQLIAGDIFQNIVGSLDLTLDDAWEAAEMAGVANDIRSMPMGMHTVISEGASTISGGQRQRILIARAIVNRPRMIFFDEATSALDNQTQAIVSASLERLKATRVVIAHRLSTIINADRIFVMDKGQIIESGSYDELMQQNGLFAELARRQIA